MVLPVVNGAYVGCNTDTGELEDPRLGPATMAELIPYWVIRKATLDGVPTEYLDTLNMVGQDGGFYTSLSFGGAKCTESIIDFELNKGCPLGSGFGPYVFLDTKKMAKGKHTLILIGEITFSGFCSAVRHEFTLV
jgi:hypothetical protein